MNQSMKLAVCLLVGWSAFAVSANERPNVIVIMADDLGAEGLACYGSTIYTTPNLDRMAALDQFLAIKSEIASELKGGKKSKTSHTKQP